MEEIYSCVNVDGKESSEQQKADEQQRKVMAHDKLPDDVGRIQMQRPR